MLNGSTASLLDVFECALKAILETKTLKITAKKLNKKL
jgi:hypothetical protein